MQEAVEDGAGALALPRLGVGGLELAEDLRLAEYEGIEARRHAEQVAHGFIVFILVEVRLQFVHAAAAGRGPAFEGAAAGGVAVAHHEHFHAVAGGEDEGFADAFAVGHGPRFRRAEIGEREFFTHLHGGGAVIDAYEMNGAVHNVL